MKICPKCHKEFEDSQKFCGECGVELFYKKSFCPNCGKEIEHGQTFCGSCGTKIEENSFNDIAKKAVEIGQVVRDKASDIVSKENIDKAATQINNIASAVRNSEFVSNSADNIKQSSQQLAQSVKNFNPQDFSFDLVKMFPTSDSQYDALLKFARFYLILSLILTNFGLNFVLWIPLTYIAIYIFIKSGTFKYIAKIILGLFITLFICSLGRIISPDGFFMFGFLSICFAIYINKKRFAFVKGNSQYILYPVGFVIASLIVLVILIWSSIDIITVKNEEDLDLMSVLFVFVKLNIINGLYSLGIYYFLRRFIRQEQARGLSFIEMSKRFVSVPLTAFFYLCSFMTIFHFFDADPNIINGDIADGNSADGDLKATDVASANLADNTTSPVNTDIHTQGQTVNTLNSNSDVIINDKIGHAMHFDSNSGILYDKQGSVVAHMNGNNLIDSHNGKIIAQYDSNTNNFYDGFHQKLDIKIDNGTLQNVNAQTAPIADSGVYSPNKIETSNNSIEPHSNLTESENQNLPKATNPNSSDDVTIKDNVGHTIMHFDSEQGILCDGTGKEIAYLQDNRLVTVEGKTIATYNRDMSTFYDENMQPLDVKMDGGTFQHVKDAKGNGVEILNNEISDAKTHKKIGDLEA